ncbi:unnamed protein product [Microthlaspi erraticum]|uniref:F-box domain-containing protein n=1 Tax=Microthlaspi erraticum TaxID=1685480 RepID=A0A6D2KX81_9BRAS|nr:unnamed protein product [Microthlaspi erraticum]
MSLPVSSTSSSLPIQDELIVSCFAKVPRSDYPSLSLVSKPFSRLIASPEINLVRSLSQSTENVLYVALGIYQTLNKNPWNAKTIGLNVWYTLNQKPQREGSNPRNHKLVPFPSFPSLPCRGASVIAVGNEIYVFGGFINGEVTSNVFVIDSRFCTSRFLPSMRVARSYAAVGVVDGKIYVIGGCEKVVSLDIEVLDVKAQTWECSLGFCSEEMWEITMKSVVMNEKIYIMDAFHSFVYDPKTGEWDKDYLLDEEWGCCSCVIDNMLFTLDYQNNIKVYDPKAKSWTFMMGVEDLPNMISYDGSRMANHGGKLAILYFKRYVNLTEIWYTEIALKKREGKKIWGKVLWYNLVISLNYLPTITECLDVMI